MVRPCAKYARLDCYAPLQVTANVFAVTWSGLFTYAKLATFLGLVWGHARQNIFTETAAHRKHPTAKVSSKFFGMSHTRTSVLLGLVPGRIGGGFYAGASLRRQLKTAEGIDHFRSALPLGRGTFHRRGGAEQKMSRGTALPAQLDKQSPNDRALRGLPLTGPRTVSERSSRGGGVLRGNPSAACMKKARLSVRL